MRVKRSGAVLEPASGAFDVTVAPGEDVQAAVNRCPPGGSVMMLPGMHDGSLMLAAGQEVHVFARGLATLRAAAGKVVTSAAVATVDGLVVRREAGGVPPYVEDLVLVDESCVWIKGGALRLQNCDVASAARGVPCVYIYCGADPVLAACQCVPAGLSIFLHPTVEDE